MGKRSPVLGYNHNFKHRGLIFHVQTEDSGVDNPHLFTHLFHGGVIISSRKIDYDSESEVDLVKSLMQSQHKAVLKDLKIGTFDNKIDAYLGNREDLEPRKADSAAGLAGEDTETDAEAQFDSIDVTNSAPAPSDMSIDAPEVDDPEGLTFDAFSNSRSMRTRAPVDIRDEAASTDEMPSISLEAEPLIPVHDPDGTPTANVENAAAAAVAAQLQYEDEDEADRKELAEARAAAAEACELAAKAEAEAAHLKQLRDAAAAASARAAELEAKIAAHSKSQAHRTAAHSGAISLDSTPPSQNFVAPNQARITKTGPIVDIPETPQRRRHLPTAVEMPAYAEDSLGDPTVTFSAGGSKTAKKIEETAEVQAIPEQITGERSGTYSMKRQNTTQRIPKHSPTQPPRGRTGSGPVLSPVPAAARTPTRRSATGKAANPEPGRPRSSVVVSRPAVIIGAPPKMVGKGVRKPAPRKARSGSVFGKDLISEKSLDEVIMAYLSEDSSEE